MKAGVLFRLANEIEVGDLVIYPSKANRMVNIGTVENGYLFNPGEIEERTCRRRARWHQHIPRSEFSQNALNEIGPALTLFKVSNNAEEFLDAFKGTQRKRNDEDDMAVASAAEKLERTTEDFVFKKFKTSMTPRSLKNFVLT